MNPTRGALRIGIDGRELEGQPTGVGRYLRSLLRRFPDLSPHEFVVYSIVPVSLPGAHERIRATVIPAEASLWWEQRLLPARLAAERIDVLLSPAYSCPVFTSIPRVTAIHDLSFFALPEEFSFTHGLRRRTLARLAARSSRSILACSEFTKSEIARHLGASAAAKTRVVRLGPDDDLPQGGDRSGSRAALGLNAGDFYVITVGTILRRRNIGTLVKAIGRLAKSHAGIRLGVIGADRSDSSAELTALANQCGCDLRLSGFVTDAEVVQHYAAADAAVFLSGYEGFGLPALEAMSRGIPTVVANRGSLVEHFSNGAIAVEAEVNIVASALERLAGNPGFAKEVAARGRTCAATFSWESTARETLAALEGATR